MKHHRLQASLDPETNSQVDLDHFNSPSPDDHISNQFHELHLPPPYSYIAMDASPSLLEWAVGLHDRSFLLIVVVCTILSAITLTISPNPALLSNSDPQSAWHLALLWCSLVQNTFNAWIYVEFLIHNRLLTHNQGPNTVSQVSEQGESGTAPVTATAQTPGTQPEISFWPLWFYSSPVLVVMIVAYVLATPIIMITATSAHAVINITYIVHFLAKQTNQRFFGGQTFNVVFAMLVALLLVSNWREMIHEAPSLTPSSSLPASAPNPHHGLDEDIFLA